MLVVRSKLYYDVCKWWYGSPVIPASFSWALKIPTRRGAAEPLLIPPVPGKKPPLPFSMPYVELFCDVTPSKGIRGFLFS